MHWEYWALYTGLIALFFCFIGFLYIVLWLMFVGWKHENKRSGP